MSTGTDFGDILTAAIHGGYVAHLTDQTYTISSPIVIFVDSTIQGALGIDGGGATLVSQVTDGSPLIRIVVGPGVDFRYLTLSNFTLQGNGSEGNGIEIIADGNDRWAYNWTLSDVTVQGVGGWGLDVEGSAFEGLVSNSWMNGNALGGAYFSHSTGGGVASALRWFGGGALDNGGAGVMLDNGARDLGVEGALFANNDGPGISALSGITAVSNSTFEDNLGAGVAFQNYGNFSGNVFSTAGPQTVGIDGFLAGTATLVGNTGAALADLQGSGVLFLTDNSGAVVSGPQLVPNAMGGDMAHVTAGTVGVAMPTLAAVTAATTAARPDSTGTGTVESALRAAIAGGFVVHLTDGPYTVATPIVINVTRSSQGPVGIDLGGAKIISQITDGSPVIEIIVAPGVDFGGLTLSNFSILGNGQEGDGIKIVADGADRSLHDFAISNVNVEHVGGIGIDVLGNVSQGTVFNSWMHDDAAGGARFANSAGGGEVSALEWMGGGVRKNGVAGVILDNGAYDLSVTGAYFVDNDGPGLMAPSGITSVRSSGFENNLGSGAIVLGSASFADDTFATYGRQATAIGGYLAGGHVVLTGVGNEYYGPGADPTVLANLQGQGTLAIAGSGNVVVGPNVAVTGALTMEIEALGSTALLEATGSYFLHPVGGSSGPQLSYSGAPVGVGQFGAWAPIGVEQTASGYQVVWHLGDADQYTVWTTDSSGNWLSQGATLSGASPALQSLEPGFQQDLNGDGSIPLPTMIDSSGSTALARIADVYLLYPVDGSSGPHLTYGGASVTAGQFGAWAPIGVEQAAGGYQVVFRLGNADQYTVWTTDGSGNWLSQSPGVSGSDPLVAALEPGFAQDLNGSGAITPTTVVEAEGATSLVGISGNYFLHPDGGSSGPQLRYGGAPVTAGQFGAWAPIGVEQAASGYQVVFQFGSTDQYTVWTTDGSGNWLSQSPGVVGSDRLVASLEPSFAQDLNGSGAITPTTVVEAEGETSLVEIAGNYFLYPDGGSSGPQLRYGGAPVTAGQFGAWAPIGVEQAASGYQVVFRLGSTDQYTVWTTDGSGNWLSQGALLSGASAALVSHEADFHQDLNGDGATGSPPSLLLADDPFR
jgi:hypothetical protein